MNSEIGVYVFENIKEKKAYIGQSSNLKRRIYTHYHCPKNSKDVFHRTLIEHPELFIHSVIENCTVSELDEKELYWMKKYQKNGWELYNKLWRPICNTRGIKLSEEHKRKVSEHCKPQTTWKKGQTPWNKGKKGVQTPWNKGKHLSEEYKIKLSEGHKGYHWRLNPETGKREWYK